MNWFFTRAVIIGYSNASFGKTNASHNFNCGTVICPFPPLARNVLPFNFSVAFLLVSGFDIGLFAIILSDLNFDRAGLFF